MIGSGDRPGGLLAWQWAIYSSGHTTRANLLLHILSVPLFQLGTVFLTVSAVLDPRYAIAGIALMLGSMAAQGRGHAIEPVPPVPFRGAWDALARIMAEQWIAFPRFVAGGGFVRAWRASGPGSSER